MNDVRPSIVAFAAAILALDAERHGAADAAGAAERTMARIYLHLGKLIGATGYDVMLARALVLARRTSPVLANVVAGPGGRLRGLTAALAEANDADARKAAFTLVAHFIELLAILVGDELAIRLLRDAWPDLAGGTDSGSQEGQT